MRTFRFCLLALCLGWIANDSASMAQEKLSFEQVLLRTSAKFDPPSAKPGETVTLEWTVELLPDWHTYPTVQPDPEAKQQTNRLIPSTSKDVVFVGQPIDPAEFSLASGKELQGLDGVKELREYFGSVTWKQKVVVSPKATPGNKKIPFKFRMLICKESCFPPKQVPFEAELIVKEGSTEVEAAYKEEVTKALGLESSLTKEDTAQKKTPTPKAPTPVKETPTASKVVALALLANRDHKADLDEVRNQLPDKFQANVSTSMRAFLLTAAFWGLISLVTPCVFPMIPITVSFFLKQGGDSPRKTLSLAGVYCLTIIVVLGLSAFTLLTVFRKLSVDPYMNIALGGLFIFFALSLFGMYEIVLPSFLSSFTSKREGQGGLVGTIFMALTFTIISFTCVAPFLGGFSGMAASGQFSDLELTLAGLVFATAFAAPFFVLALFPTLLKKLPRGGSWMNTIKVVMGFLELAAATKFFRTAELRLTAMPSFFTYDLVLGMWVVICVLCGLYLLNTYRLPHDDPQENIGVTRMLFAFFFLTLAVYLAPGIFHKGNERQRPNGAIFAWVDAFLLPEVIPSRNEGGSESDSKEFPWSADLKGVVNKARKEREATGQPQFVFVDFTGVTCTNCKFNENTIFPQPKIHDLMRKYHLVQMYTDTIPEEFYQTPPSLDIRDEEALLNLQFQRGAFGTEQLPLYVILEPKPDGKIDIVGVYDEGKINQVNRFTEFLEKPFANKN